MWVKQIYSKILKTKKSNHTFWKAFKELQERYQVTKDLSHNRDEFQKLIKIVKVRMLEKALDTEE